MLKDLESDVDGEAEHTEQAAETHDEAGAEEDMEQAADTQQ